MFDTRDAAGPSLLDELVEARARLAAQQPVIDAARAWAAWFEGDGEEDDQRPEALLILALADLDAVVPTMSSEG